jgi:SAM-dependent methyltransferase
MTTPPDQRDLWIANYGEHPVPAERASAFVGLCVALLPPGSRILELGCGPGTDAATFTTAGHHVTATDFVPAVIESNRERHAGLTNLTFQEMRIDEPYPFPDATFDAVYAHLTLHYYTHEKTRGIIDEIHRVLKPGGLLLFACKSPADPAYGKGTELEPGLFDFHGKVRHFFDPAYARTLLEPRFTGVDITEHNGKLYRQKAGWITVVAHAI